MSFEAFLLFMLFPVGGVALGYIALRLSRREAKRFDRERLERRLRDRHA